MKAELFQLKLLRWFDQFGRHDLPWQHPTTAYRVWVSEVMLQQTQVTTVIPYFNKFIKKYPDIHDLAKAPIDEVLSLWAGLGYYARARNLHKAAGIIQKKGNFPKTLVELMELPGIGKSTAGAILSIVFAQREPILDGNVRRVFARFKAIHGWTGGSAVNKQLWEISRYYTPQERVADYTQAIMDLGATVCTRSKPSCEQCPLQTDCIALQQKCVPELPTPKPNKKRPVKQVFFVIAINDKQEILLEKRAPVGIWGGLWSVPELANKQDLEAWCVRYGLVISKIHTLTQRRHTFSHYHLDYVPLLVYVNNNLINNVLEAGRVLWYKHPQTKDTGLPAPVKQLFDQLSEDWNG